jgi:hypothetical protein
MMSVSAMLVGSLILVGPTVGSAGIGWLNGARAVVGSG